MKLMLQVSLMDDFPFRPGTVAGENSVCGAFLRAVIFNFTVKAESFPKK